MADADTLVGADSYCFKAFAEALEIIPYTLAENAGLNPISTVTELRNKHAQVRMKSALPKILGTLGYYFWNLRLL